MKKSEVISEPPRWMLFPVEKIASRAQEQTKQIHRDRMPQRDTSATRGAVKPNAPRRR